jgi:hypothetical protein
MEGLTKTQLVLLTLLLSFVTSIATGIMTASLLQSAPPSVTQTINRVVERTIEKVSDSSGSTTSTKEVQVVSEDDKVTSAITQNQPSLVSIRQIQNNGTASFYGVGIIISKDGQIITERTTDYVKEFPYTALLNNGSTVNLALVKDLPDAGFLVFKADNTTQQTFTPVSFTEALPKLGQTVILMEGGGADTTTIVGRIANIQGDSSTTPKTIVTDTASDKDYAGAPILDLSGNVLGIRESAIPGGKVFYFAPRILSIISK